MISPKSFYSFIRVANFESPGRPAEWAYRARAAAGLAYCLGLWLPEILALQRRHWCPDAQDLVIVDGDRLVGVESSQTHHRILPVPPAARFLVGQFLRSLDGARPEQRFFAIEGAPPLKLELRNAARRSGVAPEIKPGDLRASFETLVLGKRPADPLAFYMVGRAPTGGMQNPFVETDPSVADLDALLREFIPSMPMTNASGRSGARPRPREGSVEINQERPPPLSNWRWH